MKSKEIYDTEIQNVLIEKYLQVLAPLSLVLTLFVVFGLFTSDEIQLRRLLVALSILMVTVVATILNILRKNRYSIGILLLGLTALVSLATIFNGGFQSPGLTSMMALFAITGLLFPRKITRAYFIYFLTLCITMFVLSQNHLLPRPELPSDLTSLLSVTAFMTLLYGGLRVINGQLHEALCASKQNEQKLADSVQKLRDSEELLRLTFDLFPIPVTITRATGTVSFHNRTFTKLFGYTIEDLPDVQTWVQTVYPTPEYAQEMLEIWIRDTSEAVEKGTASKVSEHHILAKDGTPRIVEAFMQPIGEMYVNIFADVTEQRRREEEREKLTEQLHQSRKLEAVGQLAGGVAHDFNNALGGIIGAAELIRMGCATQEECNRYCDLILTAAGRAGNLTDKLLTFSRKGGKVGTEKTAVDCAKMIADTMEILTHSIDKNIRVTFEKSAQKTWVFGDEGQLQNALMNMGINASHAMPDGGELTFTLKNCVLDAAYCTVSPFELDPGEYVEITIGDTGCGMAPEILSRVFEPFFTTKEQGKGTGLGMAAVYGTVQDHHGEITVHSEVGSGTVFHVYLPVSQSVANHQPEPVAVSSSAGTVLVIDDESSIRITMSAMLRSLGYSVVGAVNGLEGIEKFREAKGSIDLIILDMIMPIMGGREAFAQLREIDPKIPIVIASGFAKEDDLVELKDQEVSGFLKKPFRKADLVEIVGKASQKNHGGSI